MAIIKLFQLIFFVTIFNSCQQHDTKLILSDVSSSGKQLTQKPNSVQAIYRSNDNGITWQDVSSGLPPGTEINCVIPFNTDIILASSSGMMHGNKSSSDLMWKKDFSFFGEVINIFPSEKGIYAVTSDNDFYQKIQGTAIWLPVFSNLKQHLFFSLLESKEGVLFIGTGRELLKSIDHGKTWKEVYKNGWIMKIIESDGIILCTNEHGIIRSDDGGEHWETVISEGGVGINIGLIDGGFSAITYNTNSKIRRMRISLDKAKTWQEIDTNLPKSDGISSIIQSGDIFLCGHPNGILRSTDKGKTWNLTLPSIDKKVFNLTQIDSVIFAVPRNQGC
jgi:hypothetical protein